MFVGACGRVKADGPTPTHPPTKRRKTMTNEEKREKAVDIHGQMLVLLKNPSVVKWFKLLNELKDLGAKPVTPA